ncbi:MAG: UDP-2,4-diacetamido-2,4,6-trideoxy-beta-L-altropyranose hydrolase [Rhodospirillales bacterium]|nr:UDP-2,4-diacetamido-2,4,6-trideoxy-beta-L-altropyranose hydrolase [Rhodospirillales bacterium]
MAKVIFRADATIHIGGGHVMRCLSLASVFERKGWMCEFITADDTVAIVPALEDSGYKIHMLDDTPESADLLVVDHYGLDAGYERMARAWAQKILVLDDLVNRSHDCDILMDQTYGREALEYQDLVPAHCQILTGADYAVLRAQFSESRGGALKRRHENRGQVCRLFLMMSAVDDNNVTGFVLQALEAISRPLNVDVVMGGGAPHLSHVREQVAVSHHDISLHVNAHNVAALMVDADLAIGAGGTSSWERCCLGLPTVTIEIADNQKDILRHLQKAGAIINAGRYEDLTQESFQNLLHDVISRPDLVYETGKKAEVICDGRGTERLVLAVEEMLGLSLS